MIGRPAILISCLGMSRPTRVPTPPASRTATFLSDLVMKRFPFVAAGRSRAQEQWQSLPQATRLT